MLVFTSTTINNQILKSGTTEILANNVGELLFKLMKQTPTSKLRSTNAYSLTLRLYREPFETMFFHVYTDTEVFIISNINNSYLIIAHDKAEKTYHVASDTQQEVVSFFVQLVETNNTIKKWRENLSMTSKEHSPKMYEDISSIIVENGEKLRGIIHKLAATKSTIYYSTLT